MGNTLFGRDVTVEPNFRGIHHIVDETLEDNAVFSIHRITMQGGYDDLKALRDEHYCNELITDGADTFWTDYSGCKADLVISQMSLLRRDGGRGTLTFTIKAFQRGYEAGIDFETISKDIIYWRQLCNEDVPDLTAIRLWSQMKDDQATVGLYYEFKYQAADGTVKELPPDSPTLALAEMMARGVESFNEYIPTMTITYNLAKHPTLLGIEGFKAGALLGRIVENTDLALSGEGFSNPLGHNSGSPSPVQEFESLDGAYILCTADQLRCNSDGSYTLTRAFAKYRQVEIELYLGAPNAKYTPYDETVEGV